MSLRRNVAANFLGQGWGVVMSLAFVPVYVKYLGVEAYGLIGVFGLLQAWLNLLDMGLTPALSREMAKSAGGAVNPQYIRDLLRSVEVIALSVAIVVALAVFFAADWLASNWLRVEKLPLHSVAYAFATMGFVTALRAIENIYKSSLVGLEQQVKLNAVSSVMVTVRSVGAVLVLIYIAPTIEVFFAWQFVISIVSVVVFLIIVYRTLPPGERPAKYSLTALKNIWHFASGVFVITLLSFLLMQIDKILLMRLLSLENFGYYTLAVMISSVLYMMVGPFDAAFFPRFTARVAAGDAASLTSTFHLGAQCVSVFVGSAAVVLTVFGYDLLLLWLHDATLAARLAPLLAALSVGTLLNCLMHMPYQLQLAHGWTQLMIYVNSVAVLVLVPAIFWVVPQYGALGAAWAWVALNAAYVIIAAHLMFRRLIPAEKWRWYLVDVLMPLIAALVAAVGVRAVLPTASGNVQLFFGLTLAFSAALSASIFCAPLLKSEVFRLLQAFKNREK